MTQVVREAGRFIQDGVPEEDLRSFAGWEAERRSRAVVTESQKSAAGWALPGPGGLVTRHYLG